MKAKINKTGTLEIERGGKFKNQICPYRNHIQIDYACGDWCPLFGEPEPEKNSSGKVNYYGEENIFIADLQLCKVKLIKVIFTDERQSNES